VGARERGGEGKDGSRNISEFPLNFFKRGFRIKQTKQELTQLGLNLTEGNTPAISISAMTGEGIPELLDAILLEAGLMDIKADKYGQEGEEEGRREGREE
jgi:translation initiation factor IF-2